MKDGKTFILCPERAETQVKQWNKALVFRYLFIKILYYNPFFMKSNPIFYAGFKLHRRVTIFDFISSISASLFTDHFPTAASQLYYVTANTNGTSYFSFTLKAFKWRNTGWLLLWRSPRKHNAFITVHQNCVHKIRSFWTCSHQRFIIFMRNKNRWVAAQWVSAVVFKLAVTTCKRGCRQINQDRNLYNPSFYTQHYPEVRSHIFVYTSLSLGWQHAHKLQWKNKGMR